MDHLLAFLFLPIPAGCVLPSCGGGTGSATHPKLTNSPTSLPVPHNTQTTSPAVVNLSNPTVSTTTTVTWEVNGVSGGDISTIGSISASPDNQLEGIYT